jgi:hypothetical protein
MDKAEVIRLVDEYAKWDKLATECKIELEKLKGKFQELGVDAMTDTKTKQVEFWGSLPAKVVVTTSESLKVVSHTFLSRVLGGILKDFAKEDLSYKYTEPFKRIIIALFQGNYIELTVETLITQITQDAKEQKVLKKKLKGNWEKDVNTLQNIIHMPRQEAEHYAFFIQEAINYERIVQLLEAAGHMRGTTDFEKAIKDIKNAVIVEEGIKVGIESNKEA